MELKCKFCGCIVRDGEALKNVDGITVEAHKNHDLCINALKSALAESEKAKEHWKKEAMRLATKLLKDSNEEPNMSTLPDK